MSPILIIIVVAIVAVVLKFVIQWTTIMITDLLFKPGVTKPADEET